MSSTKSAIGHLLGAAGAVEAIFSILAIRDHIAPPTLNLDNPSVETPIDLVPHEPRKRAIDIGAVELLRLRRHQRVADLPPRQLSAASNTLVRLQPVPGRWIEPGRDSPSDANGCHKQVAAGVSPSTGQLDKPRDADRDREQTVCRPAAAFAEDGPSEVLAAARPHRRRRKSPQAPAAPVVAAVSGFLSSLVHCRLRARGRVRSLGKQRVNAAGSADGRQGRHRSSRGIDVAEIVDQLEPRRRDRQRP